MIEIVNKWGSARTQASTKPEFSGLTASQAEHMRDRFEAMLPGLSNTADVTRGAFKELLPEGADWAPGLSKTAQIMPGSSSFPGNSGGKTLYSTTRPYQPEMESPDRQQYPVHRILANRYWRLFYKLDPVIGNCIDMYADMPWSKFKLTGPGVEGSIRNEMEAMVEETNLLTILPAMVREFFVTGECVPHCFYNDNVGRWEYIALHNPDQLEVIDAPFIKMDPIVEFIPDDRLRTILSNDNPALRKVREKMPPALLSQLQARQNIPLSPINATFIPRKLHPYDTRGTSILSRLWRILMYEDSIFNASIQTARRHAGPLKVAKIGNPQTGWIPGPEHEAKLLQLLAQAELDPHAWLVYHYGIAFETVGTTDRVMTINREWEIIERIKLVALGISKSFLHGEVTYASAATGLQVFLQRLKALRTFFENAWLKPKFFLPIAEMNGWVKPKPSEVAHKFRVKRSQRELLEEKRYIIPEMVWEKSLDPAIDANLINAMQVLEGMGCKFSKTTKMATIGISFEEEAKKASQELEFERQFLPKLPSDPKQPGGAGGGGMVGGGDSPPAPGGEDGDAGGTPPPGGEEGLALPPGGAPPAPAGAALDPTADKDTGTDKKDTSKPKVDEFSGPTPGLSDSKILRSKIWTDNKHGNWHADEVEALVDLLETLDTESAFWSKLGDDKGFKRAIAGQDRDAVWTCINKYLETQDYPDSDIEELHDILVAEHLMVPTDVERLKTIENLLPNDSGSLRDDEFNQLLDGVQPITPGSDSFLAGAAKSSSLRLTGDISDALSQAKARMTPKTKSPKRSK